MKRTPIMISDLEHNNQDIEISVKTQYIKEQSEPQKDRFVFAYTITITNKGNETVQLLSRYWKIYDGNEKTHEVEGEGVVGKQPKLAPGENFSYTSGTAIATPVGQMEGHYVMETINGEQFQAPIPAFNLAYQAMIH